MLCVTHRGMSSESEKGDRELAVFAEFVRIAALPVDGTAAVQKRLPPEPDLLCALKDGGNVAFELVELCDPNLARAFADPLRPGNEYIRTSDPSASIVSKKLQRRYATEHPIELLCYTAGRIATPGNIIVPTLKLQLRSFRHVFRRAWLLCRQEVAILWGDA